MGLGGGTLRGLKRKGGETAQHTTLTQGEETQNKDNYIRESVAQIKSGVG